MDNRKVIITSNPDSLSLTTIGNADVILHLDTNDFYYVYKDKLHGYRGSLHKSILIQYLRGDFFNGS